MQTLDQNLATYVDHDFTESPQDLVSSHAEFIGEFPDRIDERSKFSELLKKRVPRWHFAMMNDTKRNEHFYKSIAKAVKKAGSVLDVGSGSGLLALMAAKAGAKNITTCEMVYEVALAAKNIVSQNGFGNQIRVINKKSSDIIIPHDMPDRAEILITETVDCGLLGEGILPIVRHARRHLLLPGARIIPQAARIVAQLISSSDVKNLNQVSTATGFDLSHFNTLATPKYFPIRLHWHRHQKMSAPFEVFRFDFQRDALMSRENKIHLVPQRTGFCDAVVFWFELKLDDDNILSNGPKNKKSHWMQAVQVFPKRVFLDRRYNYEIRVGHNDDCVYFHDINNLTKQGDRNEL